MEAPVGKIERFALRDVWAHEAHNFTKWLADNLDVIASTIGVALTLVEREAVAGDFSADLLAEGAQGEMVIIENQLGKSDHDHLGKVLTYLAAFEATTAVWIVGEPRPEHTKAVAWLNDSTPVDVFLLKAEAVRIDNSRPALLLTRIVGPSEQAKAVAKEKQERAERHELRKQFWTELLNVAGPRTTLHSGVSPSEQNWLGTSVGRSGVELNYIIRQADWRVELYMDCGDEGRNKRYFDYLLQNRASVDTAFGSTLDWQRMDDKQACRITTAWTPGGYRSEAGKHPEIYKRMVEAMISLDRAIRPHVGKLPA